MPEHFVTRPQTLRAARFTALAIAMAAIALGARTTITSLAWVGRVFPGFVVLDNRVIASVGLPHWSGTGVPGLYQSQVVAVQGEAVTSRAEVYAKVAALPPGTPVRYRLRRDTEHDVTVATERFTGRDWFMLYGVFLLNGVIFLTAGLAVWVVNPLAPLVRAFLSTVASFALFMITAMDLYGPATFFRLHIIGESLLPAAAFQFSLLFPQAHRYARWRFVGYLPCLAILVTYEVFLYRPAVYTLMLKANMASLGAICVLSGVRLVLEYWRGNSQLARQRIRLVLLGTLLGLAAPGAAVLVAVFTGELAMNLGLFAMPVFVPSLAYAVVKLDLFEIDAMVKRSVYYVLLTGSVGIAYVAALALFNLVLQATAVANSPAFALVFTFGVLLLFNPLRTRVQSLVDRVFFRTQYDSARVLADVGGKLAAALTSHDITKLVRDCVDATIPNTGSRLFIENARADQLCEGSDQPPLPPALATELAGGRVLTTFDPVELYADAGRHQAVGEALTTLGAQVAVPLRHGDELVGALTLGAKRSGFFYTAGDAEFLRALTYEAAIALQNAASYEAVVALNANLEEQVRARTAQLVQSERLAGLGRLVAGVAHEINNPVSFVAGTATPLRERLEEVAAAAPPEMRAPLQEAKELVEIMARGAERTAAIVKDLRTFSRVNEEARKPVDLREGLEVSLRLLEPRWRDRITLHRDYGALPPVECDAGQLNQVFMNLLANACDAIADRGNIWVSTRAEGSTVRVTIRDDGCGMAKEVLNHVFDPFFTTKDVGQGTGLGLAISHGIVSAHGGRIEVASTPGVGSTFQAVLPLLDRSSAARDRSVRGGRLPPLPDSRRG